MNDFREVQRLSRELIDKLWRRFREAITPLEYSGKLAAVHFQFAPWVAFHPNFEHIEVTPHSHAPQRSGRLGAANR
jgi:uncharacterized protein YecE (DUF72 family)